MPGRVFPTAPRIPDGHCEGQDKGKAEGEIGVRLAKLPEESRGRFFHPHRASNKIIFPDSIGEGSCTHYKGGFLPLL